METIGDKRVETHFICGSEKMLYNLIDEDKCEDLIEKINKIYINKNIRPPSAQNTTFSRALELPLYDMGKAILEKRYTFEKAMENFDLTLLENGFINKKIMLNQNF